MVSQSIEKEVYGMMIYEFTLIWANYNISLT